VGIELVSVGNVVEGKFELVTSAGDELEPELESKRVLVEGFTKST
jgi:hypothetical protein